MRPDLSDLMESKAFSEVPEARSPWDPRRYRPDLRDSIESCGAIESPKWSLLRVATMIEVRPQ